MGNHQATVKEALMQQTLSIEKIDNLIVEYPNARSGQYFELSEHNCTIISNHMIKRIIQSNSVSQICLECFLLAVLIFNSFQ